MSIEDFFEDAKKKGATPLSYSEDTEYINGRSRVRWTNPTYVRAMRMIRERLGGRDDNLVSRLYDEDVVIRTRDGYHYGRLQGYDRKSYYLGSYVFSRKVMDIFDYHLGFFATEDGVVPADRVISVSKVPLTVDEDF